MEFNEKLQELRKARSLTQEELAEALFVSRTAISKWESGRGYPSLDSLKEISKFFFVSIDDLICSEEIISAAEDEKKDSIDKYTSLICNTLDIFLALLLFLPVFGNGTDNPASVSLYAITGLSTWIKIVFDSFEELKTADNATQAQMIMYSKLFKINFTKMDPYEFKTFTDILQRYFDLCKPVKGNGRGKKKK